MSDGLLEQLDFAQDFCRMCSDGYRLGFHERNGGNASIRLSVADYEAAKGLFAISRDEWVPLGMNVPDMADEFVLVTGAGKYLRNVELDLAANAGIVEIDEHGSAYRLVWGFEAGAHPTSEMPAHISAHGVRKRITKSASHVLYHAHPSALVALTSLVDPDARTVTRILWKSFTESLVAIPGGVGVLPWIMPGSVELAEATCEQLESYEACVWQLHGVFASAETCDGALGLVHVLDKAADVYLQARAAAQGVQPVYTLDDDDLRAMARAYDLPINEKFLD